MTFSTAVLRGRAFAQRQFIDACTIQRETGHTTDPDTGVTTPTYTQVYSGVCKVQGGMASAGTTVGEAHLATNSPILHVPITVVDAQEGDLVTITASDLDPDLVGRTFRIQGPTHKTGLTARRLQCTEATG